MARDYKRFLVTGIVFTSSLNKKYFILIFFLGCYANKGVAKRHLLVPSGLLPLFSLLAPLRGAKSAAKFAVARRASDTRRNYDRTGSCFVLRLHLLATFGLLLPFGAYKLGRTFSPLLNPSGVARQL